ncbi:hypothetical protein K469DRAFT_710971 [Zopfia rhizophila CBS 207.26]|uniref:Uncharacterized protein n=1 Tax=Zopfia rhizophila CBS 207.26 TaxID=1314779 RepID=A0A6A6DXE5_9PEZI|nr:hypothetical protein K469DRAFT_710971 [Zopfia rhizophila CBS 207.26]
MRSRTRLFLLTILLTKIILLHHDIYLSDASTTTLCAICQSGRGARQFPKARLLYPPWILFFNISLHITDYLILLFFLGRRHGEYITSTRNSKTA